MFVYTYLTTKTGTRVYKPSGTDQYVNCIRLTRNVIYTVNVCAPSEGNQIIVIANVSGSDKYISMTRGADHWTYTLKAYNGVLMYAEGTAYSYGGHAVSDLFSLSSG